MPPEFDMQAAREVCDHIKAGRIFSGQITDAACMLPAALDEIEACGSHVGIGPGEGELPISERVRRTVNRLKDSVGRSEQEIIRRDIRIEAQAKRIAELDAELSEFHVAWAEENANGKEMKTRIAELDSENAMHRTTIEAFKAQIIENSERISSLEGAAKADEARLIAAAKKAGIAYFGCDTPDHLADRVLELDADAQRLHDRKEEFATELVKAKRCIAKQRAALKKLGPRAGKRGKALVEERAKDDSKFPELCDIVHDELMCPALDGDCEHWEGCPRKDELRQKARQQLRQEGVL